MEDVYSLLCLVQIWTPVFDILISKALVNMKWTQRHSDKVSERQRQPLYKVLPAEHHRLWGGNQSELECGFMPLAVKFNNLCLALLSPHRHTHTQDPHSPWVILFLVPCLSALIHHQQKKRLSGDLLNLCSELLAEPTASLSEPPAAQTLFQPD